MTMPQPLYDPTVEPAVRQRVGDFLPTTHGFPFVNHFPPVPVPLRTPFGSMAFGRASGGLCGGMVFAARDYFESKVPVPANLPAPPPGSPLFTYLGNRLWDSFGGVRAARYYQDMITSDATLYRGMVGRDWPHLRAEIDASRLVCLGLILAAGWNPLDLGFNHQVLCYGYDLDAAENPTRAILHVYDPNTPHADGDGAYIALRLPATTPTPDSEPRTELNLHTRHQMLRGFFVNPYRFRQPPAPTQ